MNILTSFVLGTFIYATHRHVIQQINNLLLTFITFTIKVA